MKTLLAFIALATLAHAADSLLPENLDEPTLGCAVIALSDVAAASNNANIPTTAGVMFSAVDKFGPLGELKIQEANIVTHIDKKPVRDIQQFESAVKLLDVDTGIKLTGFEAIVVKGKDDERGTLKEWKPRTWEVTPRKLKDYAPNAMVSRKANGVTVIRHNASPLFEAETDRVWCYISKPEQSKESLRFAFTRRAKSPNEHARKLWFEVDKTKVQFPEIIRQSLEMSASVFETYDVRADKDIIDALLKVSGTGFSTVVFESSADGARIVDKSERMMSAIEQLAIRTTLQTYELRRREAK